MERHAANLVFNGIPSPCSSLSIDETSTVFLPYYVGILESRGQQRAAAVDGRIGRHSDIVSGVLTKNLASVRAQLT